MTLVNYSNIENRIGRVMVNMLASSVVDGHVMVSMLVFCVVDDHVMVSMITSSVYIVV